MMVFSQRPAGLSGGGAPSPTQRVPSHQRCQVVPSVAGRPDVDAIGAPRRCAGVPVSSPPSDSHGCHDSPSQNRFHNAPSGNTAKTWSWSTAHAVAAGAEASVPPRDSGASQASPHDARWMRAPAASTQKRSIRSGPQETAAVPRPRVPHPRRLLLGGASVRPRSSATQSSSRRTAAADPRLRPARTRATGRRRGDGWLVKSSGAWARMSRFSDLPLPGPVVGLSGRTWFRDAWNGLPS